MYVLIREVVVEWLGYVCVSPGSPTSSLSMWFLLETPSQVETYEGICMECYPWTVLNAWWTSGGWDRFNSLWYRTFFFWGREETLLNGFTHLAWKKSPKLQCRCWSQGETSGFPSGRLEFERHLLGWVCSARDHMTFFKKLPERVLSLCVVWKYNFHKG